MMDRRRRDRAPNSYGGPITTASMLIMGLAAVSLLVFAPGAAWVRQTRAVMDDVLFPLQSVVSAPFAAVRGVGRVGLDYLRVHEQNRRLREENARLRAWYQLALTMRDKMERYEDILALNPDPTADVIVARVVAETDGPFVKTRVLNAGVRLGVAEDQAVLSEHGLVGRVISAGERSSRVLLLKDLNSRVPVMIERNDVRAILAGDNSERPQLRYLRPGHGLISGDRVVTSGDGGLLPRGLPVGETFVDGQGDWRVRLYSDDGPVDYVRVVRFDFPRRPDETEPAPPSDALSQDASGEDDAAGGEELASSTLEGAG